MPLILRGPSGPKYGIGAEDDTRCSLATDKAKIGDLGVYGPQDHISYKASVSFFANCFDFTDRLRAVYVLWPIAVALDFHQTRRFSTWRTSSTAP